MELNYITKKELEDDVNAYMEKAKLYDLKWIHNYFSDYEEWPIVTDEFKKRLK